MTARLTVLTGPASCGKTERLLDGYAEVVRTGPPGVGLWLSPTWRAAAEVRERLLERMPDGCLAPGVMTFAKAAEAVLQFAPVVIRPLRPLAKRLLVRQLLARQQVAGRLHHFGPIAGTAGLVDQVCEFLSEFKRLEVWPEEFLRACESRGITPKDRELGELYDAYQQCLREDNLYDAEGRFWSARALLKEGQRRPFERLRLVVADGFTDFTRTQQEILAILSRWVEHIRVALPLEAEPRRDDLFSKPLATLAELKRRHPRVEVEELARPTEPSWPAREHIERSLFRSLREMPDGEEEGTAAGIEILAAARELGEVEAVGARIKRLLVEGDPQDGGGPVRPGEIAVVFRSPQDPGSLVGEVFTRLGIPHVMEAGQRLDQSPALRALASLIRVDVEDWPLRGLLGLLASNYFRPSWPEWRDGRAGLAAARALRSLQIPRGREAVLQALAGRESGEAAALLARLGAALDRLPRRATLAGWAKAWEELAAETGLAAVLDAPRPGGDGTAADELIDRVAWVRLIDALEAADRLAEWLDQRPAELDHREALGGLADILASERVGSSGDESGRVRVLSAASIRAVHVPYVFLAGLSEKAFPRPERDDRFYSDAEYVQLIDEGLPLVARTERNREEMLLFYEAATRATRRLVLSYPAYNESAQPLSPSPYLRAVEQAFGAGRILRTDLTDMSPIPAGDDPLSPAEFRVMSLAKALDGDVSLLAGLLAAEPAEGASESTGPKVPAPCVFRQRIGRNTLAGLETIRLRSNRERFGPCEGMLDGEEARTRLAELFSGERTYSPTSLEGYATCPFRFFMDRVLKVEPVEDLALAVDFLRRGQVAHDVMAALHRKVNQELGRSDSPLALDGEDYQRVCEQALDEVLPAPASGGIAAGLAEVDRRLVRGWLADYRRQHERYDGLWKGLSAPLVPEWFEVSFGRNDDGEPPSTGEPLLLETDTPEGDVRIAGRVDRIDVGQQGDSTVFNVIDYKTGSPRRFSEDTIRAGTTLQLPLYALAVGELLLSQTNPVPWAIGYWYLRHRGFKAEKCGQLYEAADDGTHPTEIWEAIRSELPQIVARLITGMRRGDFPMSCRDERCTSFCPFSTVCRVGPVRALEKTWSPTDEP